MRYPRRAPRRRGRRADMTANLPHAIDAAMNQVTGNPAQQFMALGDALMCADRCRNEGRLMEAEAVCRQILAAKPDTPEAEHLLGVIAHQHGRLADAIAHVQ